MKPLLKREEKVRRKKIVKEHTRENLDVFRREHDKHVHKNEYQDILSTEECFDIEDVKDEK